MKRRIGMIGIGTMLALGGAIALVSNTAAQQGHKRGLGTRQEARRAEGGRFAGIRGLPGGLMLADLDLTDAQRDQIKSLVTTHRSATEQHRTQFRNDARALREATAGGQFDESRIRAIAQSQAQANVEIAVAEAKLASEVYNLLTPEQRAKVDERRARMERRGAELKKRKGE